MLVVLCSSYEDWKPLYSSNPFFCDIWVSLQHHTTINKIQILDYHTQDEWLYKLNKLCVPSIDDHVILIREDHGSYGGHFGTLKTTDNI